VVESETVVEGRTLGADARFAAFQGCAAFNAVQWGRGESIVVEDRALPLGRVFAFESPAAGPDCSTGPDWRRIRRRAWSWSGHR
jgi:hypothetical protein